MFHIRGKLKKKRIYFAGGSETTSTALTFAAYELTVNPDIQQRLYEEIFETNEKLNGQRITYDALQKMKYLDQVVCETLRKWPPLPNADRICVKNYVYDDHKFKFEIEKGKTAFIPFYGMCLRISHTHSIQTSRMIFTVLFF